MSYKFSDLKLLYNKVSVYNIRIVNQGMQSLSQLITTIILFKILTIEEFGYFTMFLLVSQFFLGIGVNSYIYILSFNVLNSIVQFISITATFLLLESIIFGCLSAFTSVSFFLIFFTLLRSQNLRLNEFYNRVDFEKPKWKGLWFIFYSRLIHLVVLIGLLVNMNVIQGYYIELGVFLLELMIFIVSFFYLKKELTFYKYKFEHLKSTIGKDSIKNTINFILYFLKAQGFGLVLSAFALTSFSIYSATRILASPITIITPVLVSLSISHVVSKGIVLFKKKFVVIIVSLFISYFIAVALFSDIFYNYFYGNSNFDYKLFTLLHLAIAVLALFRSVLESELQGIKSLKIIYKANMLALPLTFGLGVLLIYYFEIFGALIGQLIIESFMTIYYLNFKRKNVFVL